MIVATTPVTQAEHVGRAEALRQVGVEVLELPSGRDGRVDLPSLLDELGRREWTRLLVEGGAKVLQSFVHGGLTDELLVFVSPDRAAPGETGLPRFDIAEVYQKLSLGEPEVLEFAPDRLLRFVLRDY